MCRRVADTFAIDGAARRAVFVTVTAVQMLWRKRILSGAAFLGLLAGQALLRHRVDATQAGMILTSATAAAPTTRQLAQHNRSAVPDGNKRQRIVRAMERISHCADASRDEACERAGSRKIGRSTFSYGPN